MDRKEIFKRADVASGSLGTSNAALVGSERMSPRSRAGVRRNRVNGQARRLQRNRLSETTVVLQSRRIQPSGSVVQVAGLGERTGAGVVVGEVVPERGFPPRKKTVASSGTVRKDGILHG